MIIKLHSPSDILKRIKKTINKKTVKKKPIKNKIVKKKIVQKVETKVQIKTVEEEKLTL